MACVPHDPKLLRERASEARILAKATTDFELSTEICEIAALYERLADQADRRKLRFSELRSLVGA